MFRSVNSIVMAPARTGKDRSNRIAVRSTDQGNIGTLSGLFRVSRILTIVAIKFAAPRIDLAPARWRAKIARSTDGPLWAIEPDRGGYTVHPVPAPTSTRELDNSSIRAGKRSHSLILFNRGNAISGAWSIKGVSQLPKPPIITGITRKKIMINAWAVTRVLYN